MQVLKFGGTSVANAERFLRVIGIMENCIVNKGQVATVLSAPAKITDHLVVMIEKTINGQNVLLDIKGTKLVFTQLLKDLAQSQPGFPIIQLQKFIEKEFEQIKFLLRRISLLGKCQDSTKAFLICRGEKLSIAIMWGLLKARGHNVTIINPVKKLLAVGHYLESTVNIVESKRRIVASKIPSDHIILMAGFTAGNEKGELVVLGRNGSDYSASVLTACLHANCCEIWTDVDGIYTCDPNQIPEAKLLKSISYQEAVELSYLGAKILHPRAISLIAQLQIPCLIKNTINPQAPGTLIGSFSISTEKPIIKGISNLGNIVMFTISFLEVKEISDIMKRIFSAMSRCDISIILITQSASKHSISFCLSQNDQLRAYYALKDEFHFELKERLMKPLTIQDQLAIISIIGYRICTFHGILSKLFSALTQANINIVAISSQVFSKHSISVVINKCNMIIGVRITHQTFFDVN